MHAGDRMSDVDAVSHKGATTGGSAPRAHPFESRAVWSRVNIASGKAVSFLLGSFGALHDEELAARVGGHRWGPGTFGD